MNTNMAGFRWFSKSFCPCAVDKNYKPQHWKGFSLYFIAFEFQPFDITLHKLLPEQNVSSRSHMYELDKVTFVEQVLFILYK